MKIGIDKLNFFTPNAYVDLVKLAKERGIEPDKFTIGIGQDKMSIAPMTQDPYSMGANAAYPLLTNDDLNEIDLIIFASESATDASKSGAVIIKDLLGLQPFTRAYEIKQACYGATAGLMTAIDHIKNHPQSKALVIGADIARYGLATSGEVTQGAGAIAMIISQNPRLIEIDNLSIPYAEDIYDFWRPTYSDVALVDGKLSTQTYIDFFQKTYQQYLTKTGNSIADFSAFTFHLPYTKMGKKALLSIIDEATEEHQKQLLDNFELSAKYSRQIGNLYTGSLYLSIISLLSNTTKLTPNDKLAFFSYGSGATAEFFTGHVVEGYQEYLDINSFNTLLDNRIELTIAEYEEIFTNQIKPNMQAKDSTFDNAKFYLTAIQDDKRLYQKRF